MDQAEILSAAADWKQAQFTLNDVEFTVQRMGAEEGFEIYEILRPGINVALRQLDLSVIERLATDERARFALLAGQFAMSLPPDTIKLARAALFKHVLFRGSNRGTPVPLAGRIDEAFTDPMHIYQVLGRAFAVNFSESFSGLLSHIGKAAVDTPQPNS